MDALLGPSLEPLLLLAARALGAVVVVAVAALAIARLRPPRRWGA